LLSAVFLINEMRDDEDDFVFERYTKYTPMAPMVRPIKRVYGFFVTNSIGWGVFGNWELGFGDDGEGLRKSK